MKIMSKEATNKVSTIRLPNRQYTQMGKGTMSEWFRVHFPDSLLIDDLDNGQGQQNMDTSRGRTNRADWDLSKVLITQSRIKWALDTFKPYKSAGTDGIVPALLQHGAELLVPHLCRIYRACMMSFVTVRL
jgi:hypothetical protein